MIEAMSPTVSRFFTASTHGRISSPACRPTMVAPMIRAFADDRLDEAFGRALGLRAVVLRERPCDGRGSGVLRACLRLGQADVRQLGIGVGDPRHRAIVDLGRQIEQRVADDDACVIAGHVRELVAADDVADREHALVGRAQAVVDLDALGVVLDAGLSEAEAGDIGAAPGSDKQMRASDPLLPGRSPRL